MGLAFESLSLFSATPTLQTLSAAGALPSPIFGLKLGSSGSELTLGGVDPSLNVNDFTWVTLTTQVCRTSKCV